MGIKHYFKWFKNKFADSIYRLKKGESVSDVKESSFSGDEGIVIDNLMIDMNGIFHNSAQKIHQYGSHKPPQRLMGRHQSHQPHRPHQSGLQKQLNLFRDICDTVGHILTVAKPRKRLIMCVDGPAPLSKQAQQRCRRFMSALETDENRTFDSSNITPGTKFMDHLSKYIDWHIRKEKSNPHSIWNGLEIVFSGGSVPGEGEHKLMSYVRKYGNKEESFCINGMDADLIMLALASQFPKFYVLREEMMDSSFDFYIVDIGTVRTSLAEIMRWSTEKREYNMERAINDFVFLCFLVGNDFLPHIPALEIIEGGIDMMFDVYKTVGAEYGHITKIGSETGNVKFCRKALTAFMGTISQYEKGILEEKLLHKDRFYPNPLLEQYAKYNDGKYELDIESYRDEYYKAKLTGENIETVCHDFLEGMQWVLSYYTKGVPNWKWRFPYHYAPFAFDIAKHVMSFKFPTYEPTSPTYPFIQLMSVLPPKSAALLPSPLDDVLKSKEMLKYSPTEFPIDMAGCKNSWEATVILPLVEYNDIEKLYNKYKDKIPDADKRRNQFTNSYVYRKSSSYMFRSFYGDFQCSVSAQTIDI
jgi:5'-3' exonuclease